MGVRFPGLVAALRRPGLTPAGLWPTGNLRDVTHSRFAAVLEATDPRKANQGKLTPRITLGCTLDWEI